MHAAQFLLLFPGKLRLLASQFPLCPGNRHTLPGTHSDQIHFELGKGGQDIEKEFPHGIGGIINRLSQGKFHAPVFQLGCDVSRIGHRPGEAI